MARSQWEEYRLNLNSVVGPDEAAIERERLMSLALKFPWVTTDVLKELSAAIHAVACASVKIVHRKQKPNALTLDAWQSYQRQMKDRLTKRVTEDIECMVDYVERHPGEVESQEEHELNLPETIARATQSALKKAARKK